MELIAAIGVLLAIVALVRVSTARSEIAFLRRSISRQQRDIEALERKLAEAAITSVQPKPIEPEPQATPAAASIKTEDAAPPPRPVSRPTPAPPSPPRQKPLRIPSLEDLFGGRAFVWLGGIALALAGFFLVKYSIDTGILTEGVRVVLGLLFGVSLLIGSDQVRRRKSIADGTRIGQALAGAGIADLYGSLFAATTLYHFLPPWLGFAAMAGVTAFALLLSLRHGAPIAVLGLIGGYATPLMIQGEPNAPVLFSYLFLVFAGLHVLIRRQNWHWLSVPAAVIAFCWVMLWFFTGAAQRDSVELSLFLLAIAATSSVFPPASATADISNPRFWLRYLAPLGALILMTRVAFIAQFGDFEWAVYGLFSAGTIILAWFDDRSYVYAPWAALIGSLTMLAGWEGAAPLDYALVTSGFAALFAISGQVLLTRSTNPLSWMGLSAAALLACFLLAWKHIAGSLGLGDPFWAALSTVGAASLALAAARPFVLQAEARLRHRLQAIASAVAIALLSIGFAILLHQEFLAFAIAAEVFALGWISTRVDVPALRYVAAALLAVFALLLVPDAASLMVDFISGPAQIVDKGQYISTLLFRNGFPTLLLAGASVQFRKAKDDPFVQLLELAVLGLVTLVAYRLVALGFEDRSVELGLVARSVFNNILLLLALAAMRAGSRFHRIAALWGGAALAIFAAVRVLNFELVFANPLWTHVWVGALPLFNGLVLAYGLPAIAFIALSRDIESLGIREAHWLPRLSGFALIFIFVSFSVRQFFAGSYLDIVPVGSAETYTYSAVWLLLGIALLVAAVLRRSMAMRISSLAVLLLTVGKVFLYDVSELTGLWRVVSFLGLGLSLLGLSWFYSRFVFVNERGGETA